MAWLVLILLSYPIPSYPVPSYPVLSRPVLRARLPASHFACHGGLDGLDVLGSSRGREKAAACGRGYRRPGNKRPGDLHDLPTLPTYLPISPREKGEGKEKEGGFCFAELIDFANFILPVGREREERGKDGRGLRVCWRETIPIIKRGGGYFRSPSFFLFFFSSFSFPLLSHGLPSLPPFSHFSFVLEHPLLLLLLLYKTL